MRISLGLAAAFVGLFLALGRADIELSVTGRWSAPSLSQPSTPLIFSLLPDGRATEQIGSYHGTGTWLVDGTTVKIAWDSGWSGHLRPSANGFELLTWKKGSPLNGPPDDIQPARKLGTEGKR
jgi:hypothetical protein